MEPVNILMPEKPEAPRPDDGSKAPLTPAEPVPGSIGSAISVLSTSGKVGMAQNKQAPIMEPKQANKPAKKPIPKAVWIALTLAEVLTIVILSIVLFKLLNPDS